MQQQLISWWHDARHNFFTGPHRFTMATVILSSLLAILVCARADIKIGDWLLTSWSSTATAPKDIVIVAIDEPTLATLPYRSPIDRRFLAELIQHIDKGAPRAIGIDILFDQASEPAKDQQLLKMLRSPTSTTIVAYADEADGLTPKQAAFLKQALDGLNVGHVVISRDAFDGTVRHWPEMNKESTSVPLFATAIAMVADKNSQQLEGRVAFSSDSNGAPFAFPTYPASAAKLLPPQWFKDKIVLIGATLPNIDQHQTPFTSSSGVNSGSIYGVKIHAHMIAQLLNGRSITLIGTVAKLVLCLGLAGLTAAGFITLKSLPMRLAFVGLLLSGLIVINLGLYRTLDLELPLATLLATAALSSAAFIIRDWHTNWSERRFIQKAFGQYVSPALVDRIAANHDMLKLGGEQRAVTYIFTDLEGFTSLSENLPPEKVSNILNAYLDGMCDLFVDHGATIDKIIGDAVVGLYGAPENQPDHANQAVALALAIDKFAEDFRRSPDAQGVSLGVTRIGLHNGPAVVGNFGGQRFFDYTAIGDTVNTAARLEGANKYLGTRICVSQSVSADATEHLFRPIGDLILKGKDEPVRCFEPIARNSPQAKSLERYSQAFELLSDKPAAAQEILSEIQKQFPTDGLIGLHLTRASNGERGVQIELESK
ncbi:MAG: adenylate/guanylate cyclase domain-containing protein [Pseudomonadota bacterium]